MTPSRANIGCGSIQPEGWFNFDIEAPDAVHWDVRQPVYGDYFRNHFDYAVASFSLNELDHHELIPALVNIRAILAPGGALRILVPDFLRAVNAWERGDEGWFPQDDRTGGLSAKLCTFVTWYGTVKSVFTLEYLAELVVRAGFQWKTYPAFGTTETKWPGIVELDSRPKEALILEAVK